MRNVHTGRQESGTTTTTPATTTAGMAEKKSVERQAKAKTTLSSEHK